MEATYYIDAILEFELEELPLVADRIQERPGQELPLTFDELGDYDDFIDDVVNTIGAFGFEIVKEYQSPESYSYYVDVKPFDVFEKPIKEVFQIRFRVSDHSMRGLRDRFKKRRVFKSFILGSREYDNPVSLILGVEDFCKKIQSRDFSELMKAR